LESFVFALLYSGIGMMFWNVIKFLSYAGDTIMKNTALNDYVQDCLQKYNRCRGDIPEMLGLTNTNKALRRLDAVLSGNLQDEDMIKRLRSSSCFGGAGLEDALRGTTRKIEIDEHERILTKELRHRQAFRQHGWIETDLKGGKAPRGIICIAIPITKFIYLPDELLTNGEEEILLRVGRYFNQLIDDKNSKVNESSIFGEPIRILFRDSFDHCHVFDIKRRRFIGTKSIDWKRDEIKCLYY
jgi:hypothetical protein